MPTFDNGESGFSVRTKINAAIEKVDGTAPITAIDVNGGSIDGAIIGANAPVAVTATNLVANTDLTIASSTTVTAILDEDDLVSDSATALATQQSIKAYVDGQVGDVNELSEILANGNTSGANDIIINASQKITVDTIDETTADGGVTIDSVLLKDNVVNATDIEASSISANDGTEAATIADSTGVITVPSSVLTTADINGGTADNVIIGGTTPSAATVTNLTANTDLTIAGTVTITSVLDEDNMASNDPAGLATQQSIKAYVDAQVGANNELSEVLANGNTTGGSDIIVSSGDVITTNTINETTSASGVTIDGILLKDGDITLSGSVDGRDIAADGTKLDGIEASADVTDTANVTAAGALMDSEITNLDQVKAFDSADYATAAQGTTADAALPKAGGAMTGAITTNSTFDGRNVSADGTKLDFITVTQAVDLDQMEIDIAALANGMVYKGDWDASSGSFPGAGSAQIGWFYYVSVAGTVDSVSFDVGDNIVATTDNASSTTFAGNWSKHDQTDAVQSVVGLTGSIAKSSLLTALNVEDGADVTDTANVTAAGALMTTGGTMSGDLTFGDDDKIIMGAGSDLQLYHDGSNSYIQEIGTGNLFIASDANVNITNQATSELKATFISNGAVELYYDNAKKFETTSTGIDVTGTITADDLTVDTSNQVIINHSANGGGIRIDSTNGTNIGSLRFGDVTDNYIGALEYNHTDDAMTMYVNNATRMTINSSGNVGIGATSPARKLDVAGNNNAGAKANYIRITDTDTTATANNQAGGIEFFTNDVTPGIAASIEVLYAGSGGGGELTFSTNASSSGTLTEAVRIDENGNVGIGTSSPSSTQRLHVFNAASGVSTVSTNTDLTVENSGNTGISILTPNTSNGQILFGDPEDNDVGRIQYNHPSDYMAFFTNAVERLRIDSSGKVKIASPSNNITPFNVRSLETTQYVADFAVRTNGYGIYLRNSSETVVGTIIMNASSTAYNTSSDYRLKTDVQPMVGASERVQALNPVNFEWISEGTRVDGFLAHEAATVVPEAVTGTQDAMMDEEYEVTPAVEATYDDEGNELTAAVDAVMGTRSVPEYQGIDQSKLVPLLTAALQEALTKIESLEARIAALEA